MMKSLIILTYLLFGWVTLAAQSTFSSTTLSDAIINHVYSEVGIDAIISISDKIEDVSFAEPGVKARFIGSAESLKGNSNVAIEFMNGSKIIRRMSIPVRVKTFGLVPVAIRDIRKGEKLSQTDVAYEKKETTYIHQNSILNNSQIDGSVASISIRKGSYISSNVIEEEALVKSGERVRVNIISGSVQITVSGEALNEGSEGDLINVRSSATDQKLKGIIYPDKSVKVIL